MGSAHETLVIYLSNRSWLADTQAAC